MYINLISLSEAGAGAALSFHPPTDNNGKKIDL